MSLPNIPVFRPSITEEEIAAVAEVLRSGWLGQGPRSEQFQQEFARFSGVPYAVGVNSCTAALHLALSCLGVGKGDAVVVPALTFVSTAHVVIYQNAQPILADVDPVTLCLRVQDVEKVITPKTRAIIVVHYGGQPARLSELVQFCTERKIHLIEDCAHACGASYYQKPVGGWGDAGCFSFQAIKNLTTGDGGMLTLRDKRLAKIAHQEAWLGISSSTWERVEGAEKMYSWEYAIDRIGYKYHMNDIMAAIGLVQLKRLPEMNGRRREIAGRYHEAFAGLGWLDVPREMTNTVRSWWNYPIRVPAEHRTRLVDHMRSQGISVGVHYKPLHLQECYKYLHAHVPVTDREWERLVSLPIFPDLTDDQQQMVINAVGQFGRTHGL